MHRLLLIFSLALFFSCGEAVDSKVPNDRNILENFSYSIDTVVVDPGDEIINLKHLGSTYTSLSSNKNQFYFFDRSRFMLHEIDLASLKLVNNYPFEEEGPDGTGRLVYYFKSLSNGNFWVQDLSGSVIFFSKTGKKIGNLNIDEKELLKNYPFGLNLVNQLHIDLERRKLYSLPIYLNVKEVLFAVLDSLGQNGKIMELQELQEINKYKITFNDGNRGGHSLGEFRFLQVLNGEILISSTFTNAIYRYDPDRDSLVFQEFQHVLTPLKKDVTVKNEVNTQMEFQVESDKLHTQINYYDFYWDDNSQLYYRFASKGLPTVNIDSPKKYEHFLFVYDKELTLKGETRLNNLENIPRDAFFKDGKLWSYVNIDDELGFAVFTFDF